MSSPRGVYVPPLAGPAGPQGPAATIAVGSTTPSVPGGNASVNNSGSSSAAVFDFTLPRGDTGPTGAAGSVGATGAAGSVGATGAAGTNGTNGTDGATGATGGTGPAGPTTIGTPNALTPVFGTVYQATDTTKPSWVSAMIETVYQITLANTQSDTVELRIGSSSTGLSAGSSGTAVATFKNSLTGITLGIGMGTINRNQLTTLLPAAWYWVIRRVAGTTATITSATDQSLG